MRKIGRRTVLSAVAGAPFLGHVPAGGNAEPIHTDPDPRYLARRVGPSAAASPSEITRFTILHTNDEHSHLVPFPLVDYHPEQHNPAEGGFARVASKIDEFRREREARHEDVLLISAGDIIAGPPFGWLPLAGVAPELELLQHLEYDAVVIGNHEFDYGPDVLADYLVAGGYPEAHADLPVLGTNIDPPAGHQLSAVGLLDTTSFELRDGTEIGVFSLIGADAVRVAPLTDPVTFSDQHETARRTVAQLREDGADIVMAITHSGVREDRELAREVDGLDLVIGGHSHDALYEPIDESGTTIVQAGYHLKFLGVLELGYHRGDGRLEVLNDQNGLDYLFPIDATVPEDAETAALVGDYEDLLHGKIEPITDGDVPRADEVVMHSAFPLRNDPPAGETPLGNFVTDAMRLVTQTVIGESVDFALQADGLIRERLHRGRMEWARDEVLFYDLVTVAGVGSGRDGRPGYPVVSFWLTEEEVLRSFEISILLTEVLGEENFLQVSGGRMSFDPDRAVWLTVPHLDIPIPAYRATMRAERYTGQGIQDDDRYERLEGGDRLYRIATSYAVASQIPMVGELVPRLRVVPRDADGNPIDLEEAIVQDDGRELKVWETLVRYARAQPPGADGQPWLDERYGDTEDRLVQASGFPLLAKPLAAAALAAGAIGYGLKRWRAR